MAPTLAVPRVAALAAVVVVASLVGVACDDGQIVPRDRASGTSTAPGSEGAPASMYCVSSPPAAPMPGTDECPAPLPEAADTFDAALAAGGLDRCHVRLLPEDVALSTWPDEALFDKHRLPDFAALQRGPLRLPGYARETRDWLDAALAKATPVAATMSALAARRGKPIAATCLDLGKFEPRVDDPDPLASAVLLLDQRQGGDDYLPALAAAAAKIPISLQQKLARVLGAIDHAATEVKAALGTTNATELRYLGRAHALYLPATTKFDLSAAGLARLDEVDLDRIATAAALLATVIEQQAFQLEPAATFPPFEVTTPLGGVVVHDASNDFYASNSAAAKAALLFDLGGDDTYEVPAGASDDKHPVSIAVDVRGADHYGYAIKADALDGDLLPSDGRGRYHPQSTPDKDYGPFTLSRTGRQGAGLAGIGMLLDLGAEGDAYRSLALSQGFASMGVGVLYDAGGDDTYEAEAAAQGSAIYGLAALIDVAGADTYRSVVFSQGFAGAEAAGALVDGSGDDVYHCDPGDPALGGHPLYMSSQLPGTSNSSMSQGAAQGRRPEDDADTSYMAGGLGVLRDVKGNDTYVGSVYAQGFGYWQGLGMLLDSEGDDAYDALWYMQGSSAHFALSVFLEEGGDDAYNLGLSPAATGIGVGHDFSASFHLDLGGNDHYRAPGLSLGSGNVNGIGCLVNVGGDDVYDIAGDPTLGAGNYSSAAPYGLDRQQAATIGVFVDVGGTNTYTVSGVVRPLDETTWSYQPQPYPAPQTVDTEHGCGIDAASGQVTLP